MRFKQYFRSSVSSESKAATGGTKVFHNDDHDNYDPTQSVFSTPKITLLLTRPFKYTYNTDFQKFVEIVELSSLIPINMKY